MANDLIVPEIMLLDKLEEVDNSLSPQVWQDMKSAVALYTPEETCLTIQEEKIRRKKKMFFQDFVNKAINLPMEISPDVTDEVKRELYRLHIFCCQQTIHNPEVKRYPIYLGFRALEEMRTALVGIMTAKRLIDPSCSYSMNREFFERHIFCDRGQDGHAIIKFLGISPKFIMEAIHEEIVTDWLIYRAHDHNGIRTLTDIKNNLIDVPNFQRGGPASVEFSRFERKLAELRNKKVDELDMEYRKTLVRAVAEQSASQLLAQGMSPQDILAMASNFSSIGNANIANLKQTPQKNVKNLKKTIKSECESIHAETYETPQLANKPKPLPAPQKKHKTEKSAIEEMIEEFLED